MKKNSALAILGCIAVSLIALPACAEEAGWSGPTIQRAVDAAAARGGGRVVVPAGEWEVRPIRLRSNVGLHLEAGARLLFSTNAADYAQLDVSYCEGTMMALVSAVGATNVAITGRGEICGRGACWPQPSDYGGNQEGLRPRGVVFANCCDVRLADFLLRDSPCWGIVMKCCDGVTARRVRVDSHCNANNDGFDIEAKNVLIEDCDVDSGDDAFCLKSNDPDFVMENVVIRRCVGRSHCNGFKIGTASHGTVRHVRFEHCRTEAPRRSFVSRIDSPKMPKRGEEWFRSNRLRNWPGGPERLAGMCGIAVECVDGGEVSDIVCLDFDIRGMMTPIFVRGGTRTGRSCGTPPGNRHVLRNVRISDVTAVAESYVASSITGVAGCRPTDITLENVTIDAKPGSLPVREGPVPERAGAYPEGNMFGVLPTRGLYLRHADGIDLRNVSVRSGLSEGEQAVVAEDVTYRVAALDYLDLTEIAVSAYDDARMEEYTHEAETVGVQEHGFPRLASNLGQLVAAGRMPEKKAMLERMLTVACRCARRGKMPPKSGGNEFSVRELVMAVVALEKSGAFPPEKTAAWKADLSSVDANTCYRWSGRERIGDSIGHNWPLFGAASEQARLHFGLGGDSAYIEAWVEDQLRHFDCNGQYRDPHEPAVYDFIGRLCYMQILHFGYDGPSRAKIEEKLVAAAEPTLAMLSVCGEIPYGGRSNQFLHNNTMYAAVAEWYAAFFAKRGDDEKAARFRAAAAQAIAALEPWVKEGKAFHVKNRYPKPEANGARNVDQHWFGCERYAYFDKYMITMGTWAVLAREFAGDDGTQTIKQLKQSNNPSFSTSEHFHWKFVHSRNYTVQEDWNANMNYDASGIGRIHRRGAPPAICLSVPFAERPSYNIGVEKNPGPMAIAADGGTMSYKVSDGGVEISVSGGRLTLPVFEFDGEETTRVELGEKQVKVFYRGWVCRYATRGGTFADTGLKYFNRNGRYRRIDCTGHDFEVFVSIEKENRGDVTPSPSPTRVGKT